MSYTHLLIPSSPTYVPPFEGLKNFFSIVETLGVVPEPWELWVLDRDGASVVHLPSRTIKVPGRKIPVDDLYAAEGLLADLVNYDLRASGEGVPRRVLFEVDGLPTNLQELTETVQVAVAWHVRATPVAMSNCAGQTGDFTPTEAVDRPGFFTEPGSLKVREVPHAGAARFWISVHMGNSLRPVFSETGFDTIETRIVETFESLLGTHLSQGGTWH
ncbi:MAG TPA: hypothetical protein VGO93_13120 [Candidatus Xenobia bacterium]